MIYLNSYFITHFFLIQFSKSHATFPYLFQYSIGINIIPSLKFIVIYYQSCHDLRIVWFSSGEFLQSLPRKI